MSDRDELLTVRVKPRSSRAGIERAGDGALVVRVHAPAAEGAANRECEAALAAALGLPKSAVSIARGQKARTKQVAVSGLAAGEALARLEQAASAGPPSRPRTAGERR